MEDQRLSRRDFLRSSAIAAFVMGGLAACTPAVQPAPGAGSGEEAAAAGLPHPVTLTFVCDIINEGHVKVRDKWAADFLAANPGITVQHQPTANADYNTKVQTLFAAGTPPDIYRYLAGDHAHRHRGAEGLHLQLDDYIAADNWISPISAPMPSSSTSGKARPMRCPATTAIRTCSTMSISLRKPASSRRRWTGRTRASPLRSSSDMLQRLVKRDGDRIDAVGVPGEPRPAAVGLLGL